MAKGFDLVGALKSVAREIFPTIEKLKKAAASLGKVEDQRRSLGDKAEADFETWKTLRDEAIAKLDAKKAAMAKHEKLIAGSLKLAQDTSKLGLASLEAANRAIADMVNLSKQIEAAKKKNDTELAAKLEKQISGRGREVERGMKAASTLVSQAHAQYNAARTMMISFRFPT